VPPPCSSFVSLFIGMQSTWLLALAPEPNPRSDLPLAGNKRNDRVAAARPVLVRSQRTLVSSRLARLSPSFRLRDVSIFIKRARATAEKYSSLSRVRDSRTSHAPIEENSRQRSDSRELPVSRFEQIARARSSSWPPRSFRPRSFDI